MLGETMHMKAKLSGEERDMCPGGPAEEDRES